LTLRKQTLAAIAITLLGLLGVMYMASQRIILDGFVKVEEQDVCEHTMRVASAFQQSVEELDTVLADWAKWDETYQFAGNDSPHYLVANLQEESLATIRLNVWLLLDLSGRIVFGTGFDLASQTNRPIPESFMAQVPEIRKLLRGKGRDGRVAGVLSLPEGPMIMAARHVLKTSGQGPPGGVLIFARRLDAKRLEQLSRLTRLPVVLAPIEDAKRLPAFEGCPSGEDDCPTVAIQPIDDKQMASWAMLRDVLGRPAVLFRVTMPRYIYKEGQATAKWFLLAVLAAGGAFGVVTFLLLEKGVLFPISRLAASVTRIGASGEVSNRVPVVGGVELASLAASVNGMLASLERSVEAQQEAKRRLEEASRAKDEFLSMATHELKTPVAAIKIYCDLAALKPESVTPQFMETLRGQAEQLSTLVSDLLDVSRLQIGRMPVTMRALDLAVFLQRFCERCQPLYPKCDLVFRNGCGRDAVIAGDPARLEQVFQNLLDNAAKYSPEGGPIVVQMTGDQDGVRVSITDSGIGVEPEHLPHLFERFFKPAREQALFPGLGIGLFICRHIVLRHGGRIWAESRFGEGSTFHVWLPKDEAGFVREDSSEAA